MVKKSNVSILKRILSLSLVTTLLLGVIVSADVFYPTNYAHAASFTTSGSGITASSYNAVNFPTLDTTGSGTSTTSPTRMYYFGKNGEAFYGVTNAASSGYWELVDTDSKMGGTALSSTWGSGYSGQVILDATNGYANTYFNASDRAAMKQTTTSVDTYLYNSSWTGTGTGSVANAFMWPLSAKQLVSGSGNPSPTNNSRNGLAAALYTNAGTIVWSRSFSGYGGGYYAWHVNSGSVDNGGIVTNSFRVAPAFNLDLSKVLIARSASSSTSETSFATASSNAVAGSATGDLKFLVNAGSQKANLTSSIAGKTLTNVFAGTTYNFDYSGASTATLNGGTNYLSAILYDNTGKVAYYGNLGTISAASGTASITIPSGLTGTYKIALFEEEKCAANKTDYASTPVYAEFTVQTVDYETQGTISGDTLKNTTKNINVANNGTVEAGEVLSNANFTGNFTKLSGATSTPTVYLSLTAPSTSKVNTTSVTVPTGSSQITVYAIIYPIATTSITDGYIAKSFTINVNYESSTSFSQKDSTKSTLQVNDTFTSDMYTGTITWRNSSTSAVAAKDIYVVPASAWEGWNESERTKENVTALATYDNGKSITVDSAELNGADTYSLYTVYFPTKSGAAAYHANKWTYTSTSLYAVSISAECGVDQADYGELITDSDIITTVTLSGTNNSMTAGQIYVLPTSTWNHLSEEVQKSESKLKKVTGVNSVVIPSESDLSGAQEFDLTVVIFDYSEQNRAGSEGTACTNSTRFTTTVSIPLVSSTDKEYLSYTKSGVTWYYQKELDEDRKETGYAINVHTTNEDVNQYIDTDGAFNIPSEINGYKVKSIGSGLKARPFVPANVNSFTSVKFPSTVSVVNDYAFYANNAFMRLVIPDSVTELGSFAFYDCDNISIVTIHDTVIGAAAFGNCDGLVEITIDGTGSIGKVAFAEDINLKKVTISGNNNIGKSAFVNDTALNALNLKNLTSSTIDAYAFKDCTSIQALSIPYSNQVKAYAFDGCSGITNLELDIATVENHSFEGCFFIKYMVFGTHVNTVEYDWGGYSNDLYEDNNHYSERLDTVIYVKNKNTLFECYRDGTDIYSSFMGHYVEGGSYKYSRVIDTYVSGEGATANTHSVDGTKTSATLAYYSATAADMAETSYSWWDYVTAKDLLTVTMHTDANTGDANVTLDTKRDGITAYYDGKIYDNNRADKNKVVVKPIYSDATVATQNITDFYFFDEEEADAAIRAWIASTDYEYKNIIDGKLIENQVYKYSKYVEYCKETATITEEELELEIKAMIASIFNNKENFLAATADIIDSPTIKSVTNNQDYNIQHMMVIFYPTDNTEVDPGYNSGETGELTYYLTGFDVKTIKYTAEQGFFDQGFTYSNVAEKISELDKKIETLSTQVSELTEQKDQYQESNNEYQTKLQQAQQELAEYTQMYNMIVEQLNEYIGSTEVTTDKYFGTKIGPNGEIIPIVWINGVELTYSEFKSNGIDQDMYTDGNGNKYPIYSTIGDIDGDGTNNYYEFYIGSDGAHIITIGNENGESLEDVSDQNIVYDETIRALQRKLTAQLTAIREELSNISDSINNLRALLSEDYLDYTDDEWAALTDDEKLTAIATAIQNLQGDFNESKTNLSDAQTTVQNLNNVLVVLNKIGAGSTVTSDELQLLSSIGEFADLDQLVKADSNNPDDTNVDDTPFDQDDLDSYVNELALIIQNGCADDPTTNKNEYGVYNENTLKAVSDYSIVISSVLEGMSNEISALRTTVATQLSTISTQAQTILNKQAQIDALQSGNLSEAYEAAQNEIASLNGQLEGLSDEVEELSNQVLTMQSELSTLKTLISSIRALLDIGVNDDILEAIKGLQNTIKSNAETIEQLKANLETAQGTIGKIKSKLSTTATGDDLVALVGIGSSSDNSTGDYKTGYTNGYNAGYVAGTKGPNSNSSSNNSSTINSLTSQLVSVTAQNTTLSGENATLKTTNSSLKFENESLEKSVTSLTNKIESLDKTITTLKSTNKTLSSKVTKITSSNEKMTTKNSALKSTNSALTKKVDSLNSENSSLKQTASSEKSTTSNPGFTVSTNKNYSSNSNDSTGTSSTAETITEPEKEDADSNDTIESENTDNSFNGLGVNSEFTGVSNQVPMGTVISRDLPSESEVSGLPEGASLVALDVNGLYAGNFGTNGNSLDETNDDQKDHANIMFSYYASHLDELANLGSEEIGAAIVDDSKVVNINAIGSIEVNENALQAEALENGDMANVEIYGSSLVDGNMYLVVHESVNRAGVYDVVLLQATDGKLSCELEDLSPVSIAEISVADANQFNTNDQEVEEQTPQPVETVEDSNGTFNILFIILGVFALAVGSVIFVLMKKQKNKIGR